VTNWKYEMPVWFAVLVIARDMIIVAGVVTVQFVNGKVHVRPSWSGKVATVCQMVALSLVMLQMNFFSLAMGPGPTRLDFLDIPVYIAGLFTAISGVGYTLEGIRQLHAGGHGDPKSSSALEP
jgi:phosphatidylglycerophosphate synthase